MDSQREKVIRLETNVQAPVAEIYRAFTRSTALRAWLCDAATTSPYEGGRFYVAWNDGYYAAGEFVRATPNQEVVFTWQGRGEPGQSRVVVTLTPAGEGTHLALVHEGFGQLKEWDQAYDEVLRGWKKGLENLASVFGKGPDLRITTRPMLGIMIGDFSEEVAKKLGVPVSEGVRLDNTIEGMGARQAGLVGGDVVVAMDGKPVRAFGDVAPILSQRRAGDTIRVEYYRGSEKRATDMPLSARPMPEIPTTTAELAASVNKIFMDQFGQLETMLAGVTEEQADQRPQDTEWCVKEILAHLIHSERGTLDFMSQVYSGHEEYADSFGDNQDERVQATVRAYCTLPALMEELKRTLLDTVYYIEALPASTVDRRDVYWRLAFYLLQDPYHMNDHRAQILNALEAARR